MTSTLANCVGWLFDISIENDKAIIWIKTTDRQILKLRDFYQPSFYILEFHSILISTVKLKEEIFELKEFLEMSNQARVEYRLENEKLSQENKALKDMSMSTTNMITIH